MQGGKCKLYQTDYQEAPLYPKLLANYKYCSIFTYYNSLPLKKDKKSRLQHPSRLKAPIVKWLKTLKEKYLSLQYNNQILPKSNL